MASVGSLLLLLLMSYILISTVTISTSANQRERENASLDKLKEHKEKLASAQKNGLKTAADTKNFGVLCLAILKDTAKLMESLSDKKSDIFNLAQSIGNVVPLVGSIFSLIMTLVIVIDKYVNDRSLLKDIKEEFDRLDAKLDEYHKLQKWNIWAAGVYHKPELDIRTAWTKYKTLLGSLAEAKNDDERKRHKKSFIKSYRQHEKAPREMGELLKKTGKSFISNLGDELAEHVKCHEKEILEYTFLILTLIIKGNVMNQYYYRLENTMSKAKDEEMMKNVYEAMTAMFDIQKRCIANSMTYVLQDVKPFIEKSKKRDDLAKEVWSFLQMAYDRYDWMVVAFITLKSSHKILKTENKHVLTGFHDVSTQRITVSVARQVKGTHSKVKKVIKAIEKCITKKVLCYKVADTLSKCGEEVAGIPVSKTYTAVHAYTRRAHQSIKAKEANPKARGEARAKGEATNEDDVSASPENPSAQTPYIYTGECQKSPGVKHRKFVVLIKSDEEMLGKDPCAKLDCKNGGKCVPIEDMFLAMCQCNYPYYGLHCESDINDYRIELKREAVTDRKEPTVKDSKRRNSN
ncbi:uncharacterized protein LOC134625654 [Pelmatolapia mariae]|uniref:uncharacterized protein LOC134625654 n=1 Tax=Pelmatolapia mariae TaxID=158779 RepID=UPI002FE56A28